MYDEWCNVDPKTKLVTRSFSSKNRLACPSSIKVKKSFAKTSDSCRSLLDRIRTETQTGVNVTICMVSYVLQTEDFDTVRCLLESSNLAEYMAAEIIPFDKGVPPMFNVDSDSLPPMLQAIYEMENGSEVFAWIDMALISESIDLILLCLLKAASILTSCNGSGSVYANDMLLVQLCFEMMALASKHAPCYVTQTVCSFVLYALNCDRCLDHAIFENACALYDDTWRRRIHLCRVVPLYNVSVTQPIQALFMEHTLRPWIVSLLEKPIRINTSITQRQVCQDD